MLVYSELKTLTGDMRANIGGLQRVNVLSDNELRWWQFIEPDTPIGVMCSQSSHFPSWVRYDEIERSYNINSSN